VLVRRHPWWRPAFSGRPVDPDDASAWLVVDRYAALASGEARLELAHSDVVTALQAVEAGSVAAISLSNVPDWLSPVGTATLAAAARRALAPHGRVLVRRVVRSARRDPFARELERDPISDTLVARERTALYETVELFRR
jgi:S-adenosylmethionine:diacylglycerol 3-amino-3-carboxypropyl transferase